MLYWHMRYTYRYVQMIRPHSLHGRNTSQKHKIDHNFHFFFAFNLHKTVKAPVIRVPHVHVIWYVPMFFILQTNCIKCFVSVFPRNPFPGHLKTRSAYSCPVQMYYAMFTICWLDSNYTHYKVWDVISYPFPNFNGVTIEVWELIN